MEADNIIQLVGIALTALVAWWTLKTTFANERRKRQEEEAEKINSFLGALTTEINTLWPVYMEQYGQQLENLKKGDLAGQFPVGRPYFIVYESNAYLIGHIPDSGLRDQIVRTYIVANGMLVTIRLYNELAAKAEEDRGAYQVGSNEALRATRQFAAKCLYRARDSIQRIFHPAAPAGRYLHLLLTLDAAVGVCVTAFFQVK